MGRGPDLGLQAAGSETAGCTLCSGQATDTVTDSVGLPALRALARAPRDRSPPSIRLQNRCCTYDVVIGGGAALTNGSVTPRVIAGCGGEVSSLSPQGPVSRTGEIGPLPASRGCAVGASRRADLGGVWILLGTIYKSLDHRFSYMGELR